MSQKMRDFAAEVYPAILGTTRKDGSVQINPVWFEYRDGSFWG
ncbi:MAG TPA: pyridoxamine 5'-phosphate oxidase family protein [Candidatus Dormibacteraeota bacterium]